MGHRQGEQAALFYEFSLEKHIPAEHLLRSIDRFVELGDLTRELAAFYRTHDRNTGTAAKASAIPPSATAQAVPRVHRVG
jgi:hypothetical protein